MGAGRPTSYKAEYAEQATKLCEFGATDTELADFFKVSVATIYNWKNAQPKFLEALKAGKALADDRVERSLYQRAVGYTFDAVKIFMPAGAKKPVYAPYREHIPPDSTSMIFWLKNRRSAEWRDRHEFEVNDKRDISDQPPSAAEWEQAYGDRVAPTNGSAKSTH